MSTDSLAPVMEAPGPARRTLPMAAVQIGVLLALLAALPFVKTVDPDFWWHLRTGHLIATSGIPRHDTFSWTAHGRAWTVHEWLSELIIYAVESTLGYAGNAAIFSLATVASLVLMYMLARRAGAGTRVLLSLMILSALMFARFITVRPQVFTWLLFAAFVYVIERRDRGGRVPLWVLPPLMAVWVNLHLGFVYGLLVVGAWVPAAGLERWRGHDADLRKPLLVASGCLAATLLNPSGPAILVYPLRYLQDRSSLTLITEWQRPNFLDPLMAPYLLAIVLLALALLAKERPRPFLVLLSLAAVAMSLDAVRNMPFAALLVIPVVGSVAGRKWRFANAASDSRARVSLPLAAVLVGGVAALMVAGGARARGSPLTPSDDSYPAAGVAYLRSHDLTGLRLFNEYTWGGYLIDRLYPDDRVFIDGRTDLYRSRIIDDYVTIAMVKPGWDAELSRYGVEVLLLRKGSHLASRLRGDPRWREVFRGPVETVFLPRSAGAP